MEKNRERLNLKKNSQIRKEQKLKTPEIKKRGLFGGGSKDETTGQ